MLLNSLASASYQSCTDFDHVIMVDTVGIGVPRANKLFAANMDRVKGEYVLVLDDDDMFSERTAIQTLKLVVDLSDPLPGMVIFQCDHGGGLGVLPHKAVFDNETKPGHSGIGTCSYITRRDVFEATIESFGQKLGGDFLFFNAAFGICECVIYLEEQLTRVQRISNGKPE